jgi:hypothetical protein
MATTHMVREVSPIAPGRYWICVLGTEKQRDFDAWIRDMRGAVTVESTSLNDEDPSTEFVIFNVPEGRAPFLNAWEFGYPNTAPPEITSLQDVEKSPVVPDPLWNPGSLLPSFNLDSKLILAGLVLLFLMKR